MLALVICLVLNFCPSSWASCLLEKNFEPCKESRLWCYDQTPKKRVTFIFRGHAGNGSRFVNETTCCRKCAGGI